MEIIVGVVCAAGLFAIAEFAKLARRNPDPLHDTADPDTGISEREWMNAIR